MPIERFYCDAPLNSQTTVNLKEKEFHHMAHVIRVKEGDEIELIDGKGALAQATVASLSKHHAVLNVGLVITSPPPSFKMILAQAIPRMPRLDYILEKGTELGMTDLWLLPSERSERMHFTGHQLQRMQSITISALKQSGRLFLPNIELKSTLGEWASLDIPLFYGDVNPNVPALLPVIQEVSPKKGLIFCVGSESGFSENEIAHLSSIGGKGVKLNDFILRTDTAALCALSLISHWLMDIQT